MAYLNVKERVLEVKIVYYGAGLSGKTTNLEFVKKNALEGRCGEMMSLNTDGDRTLFFDWLPFNMGKVNGCEVKMQLYTVPGQAKYGETRRKVLAGADGVVLVLDSQSGALERSRDTVEDLREHMNRNGLSFERTPLVVQLNKRDLPSAMDAAELLGALGLTGRAVVEATASSGAGVFETLREAARVVMLGVRDSARTEASVLKAGDESGLDGHSLHARLTGAEPAEHAAPAPARAAPPVPGGGSSLAVAAAPARETAPALRPVALVAPPPLAAPAPPAAQARPEPDPPREAPAGGAMNELLGSVRAIARRLDSVEGAMQRAVAASAAEQEKRLAARLQEAIDGRLTDLSTSIGARLEVVATHAAVSASLRGIRESVDQKIGELGQSIAQGMDLRLTELTDELSVSSSAAREGVASWARSSQQLLGELGARSASLDVRVTSLDARLSALDGRLVAVQDDGAVRLDGVVVAVQKFDERLGAGLDDAAARLDAVALSLQDLGERVGRAERAQVAAIAEQGARLERFARALHDGSNAAHHATREQLEARLVEATSPLADASDLKLLRDAVAELGARVDQAGARAEHATGAVRAALGASISDLRARSDDGVARLDKALGQVGVSQRRAVELGEINAQASGKVAAGLESLADQIVPAQRRASELAEATHRLVTTLAASVREQLAELVQGAASSVDRLASPRFEALDESVKSVWTHSHNHFLSMEGRLRELSELLGQAAADANAKKPWWRGALAP